MTMEFAIFFGIGLGILLVVLGLVYACLRLETDGTEKPMTAISSTSLETKYSHNSKEDLEKAGGFQTALTDSKQISDNKDVNIRQSWLENKSEGSTLTRKIYSPYNENAMHTDLVSSSFKKGSFDKFGNVERSSMIRTIESVPLPAYGQSEPSTTESNFSFSLPRSVIASLPRNRVVHSLPRSSLGTNNQNLEIPVSDCNDLELVIVETSMVPNEDRFSLKLNNYGHSDMHTFSGKSALICGSVASDDASL